MKGRFSMTSLVLFIDVFLLIAGIFVYSFLRKLNRAKNPPPNAHRLVVICMVLLLGITLLIILSGVLLKVVG